MYSISDAMHVIKSDSNKDDETKNVNKIIIEPEGTKIENVIDKENEKDKDIEKVTEMKNESKEIKNEENIMKMKIEKEMDKKTENKNVNENENELAEEEDDEDMVLERFEFPLGSVIATVEMMFVAEEVYMTHTSGMGMGRT